jgi:hypothetical protein
MWDSVLASILSTMLVISLGFSWVLIGASLAYVGELPSSGEYGIADYSSPARNVV